VQHTASPRCPSVEKLSNTSAPHVLQPCTTGIVPSNYKYFFVVCGAFLADAYAFRSSVKTIVKFGRQYCEKKHDETLSRAMLYPPKSSVELTRELNVSKL
jgi:hypothetical protein